VKKQTEEPRKRRRLPDPPDTMNLPPMDFISIDSRCCRHPQYDLMVNCENLKDPKYEQVKHHDGRYHEIQLRILQTLEFPSMLDKIVDRLKRLDKNAGSFTVLLECKSGRHRSVAMAVLLGTLFSMLRSITRIYHASLQRHQSKMCNCIECNMESLHPKVVLKLKRWAEKVVKVW